MKRLLIPFLAVLMLYSIACFVRYYTLPPEVQAQTNTFCAANLTCSITGTWTASKFNGVFAIDGTTYPLTGAGVQSALAAAITAGGGTVDARGTFGLALSFSSEIDVGNGTAAVHLILPAAGTWTCTATDGTSYCLKVFKNSQVLGPCSGEGCLMIIQAGNGSSLGSVCGNNQSSNQYVHIEGVNCQALGVSTVANAIWNLNQLADASYVGHIVGFSAVGATVPRVFQISGSCCAATIDNVVMDAATNTQAAGTVPCTFGASTANGGNMGVNFRNFSCVHPSDGKNSIVIVQNANTNLGGSHFDNFYSEQGSGSNLTTPWVDVTGCTAGPGCTLPTGMDSLRSFRFGGDYASSTRYALQIEANSSGVAADNWTMGSVSARCVNDLVNSITLTGGAGCGGTGSTFSYNMQQGLILNRTLFQPIVRFTANGVATLNGGLGFGEAQSGHLNTGNGTFQSTVPNFLTQTSAATNFGTALAAQSVISTIWFTGPAHVAINVVQSLLGASCGAGSNTVTPTLAWTGPGGTAETLALTALSVSANGVLDSFQNDPVDIVVKSGTNITYTTASTLVSAGCSPVPQYTVYATATQ